MLGLNYHMMETNKYVVDKTHNKFCRNELAFLKFMIYQDKY